jgi:DNA-binding GntR family transcriptional regulator
LSEKIFGELRLEIITGKLRPGDRIVEMKVADSFGTSQAPVREALQRLSQEGLVETVRHTGTFVSRMSFSEIEQLFEMRRLIETTSGRILLKRASDEDFHLMQHAFDSMLDAAHAGNVIQLVASDVEFHRLLIERALQHVFLRLWSTMDGQIRRFIANVSMKYYDEMVTFAQRHQPILDAILARDEQKLIRELTNHLALDDSWRPYLQ